MKITIELDEAEVKGIKDYLREIEDNDHPTKKDIEKEIRSALSAYLQSSGSYLTDCIKNYRDGIS